MTAVLGEVAPYALAIALSPVGVITWASWARIGLGLALLLVGLRLWLRRGESAEPASDRVDPCGAGRRAGQPSQPLRPGVRRRHTCLSSRYSASPPGPSSRPTPDCLRPPHSAPGT